MKTNVMRMLDTLHVCYEVREHLHPVYTCEAAASERCVPIAKVVKTMIVRTDGVCIAALIPGDRPLDMKKLRSALGTKKLELVPREELQALTGYPVGAISPVGMRRVHQVLMDPSLIAEDTVTMSSGIPEAGLLLRAEDLADVVKAKLIEIAGPAYVFTARNLV